MTFHWQDTVILALAAVLIAVAAYRLWRDNDKLARRIDAAGRRRGRES
jgi:Ca2+/H+ antiporter